MLNENINPKKTEINDVKSKNNIFSPNKSLIKEKADIDVSIIIAAYNCEDYIDDCIKSLINQTIHNFEIICVDDGSTDSTLTKLHDYEKNIITSK